MRKPPGESFESFIDQQVREAGERGLFAHLPGEGKPLPEVDRYDEAWWIKRKLAEEGLALPLPPGLQLRRDVEVLRKALADFPSEQALRDAVGELNARIRKVNATLIEGPPSGVMPLDVEELLRARRSTA